MAKVFLWYARLAGLAVIAISLYSLIFVIPNPATYNPGKFTPTNELLLTIMQTAILAVGIVVSVYYWLFVKISEEKTDKPSGADGE